MIELHKVYSRQRSFQTLESLVLKCPAEVGPSISQIVELGVTLIKYDPVSCTGRLAVCRTDHLVRIELRFER